MTYEDYENKCIAVNKRLRIEMILLWSLTFLSIVAVIYYCINYSLTMIYTLSIGIICSLTLMYAMKVKAFTNKHKLLIELCSTAQERFNSVKGYELIIPGGEDHIAEDLPPFDSDNNVRTPSANDGGGDTI